VALAPKSEWRLLLAWDAWSVGRAQEAIDVLQDMEPDPDWISGRSRYWAVLGAAYHLAGVFEAELEAARKALATEPDSRSLIQLEVRALAALGRDQEVEARCERALTLTADHASDYQPCGQGIAELWAHGKPGPARQLADRLVAQYAIAPDGALDIAGTLLDVRDIHGAERALGDHRPEELEDPAYLEIVTLLAAARGDRAGARIGLERLDALAQAGLGETRLNRRSFRRAEVAALLGDREAAVAWLTRAFREGLRIRTALHWDFAFDGLADYPPYQALLKPVEGSDAVATTPP
jgi:tetratricopeptide (TPR) repeat protein